MPRRIVQIAVAPGAGWNGLTGEEYHYETGGEVLALDDQGQAWRLGVRSGTTTWLPLPALPDDAKRAD